jgi:hypothetical protein
MRTVVFIVAGLILLALVVALSKPPFRRSAALAFIGVWLVVSAINLYIGVSKGYSLQEELLVHAALFGIPAVAALVTWIRVSGGAH